MYGGVRGMNNLYSITRVSIPMKLTIVLLGRALADSRILCRMRASEGGKAIP